jgi:nucleotide-binding universal stress UspA family protein
MFNILVCIDGSEEGYRGLHYAIKFSLDHPDTDIALLYVRSAETAGRSSGLNMELSREAMLDWNLELPGLKSLKKARDMLVDSGFLGDEWDSEDITKKFRGTRSGDHIIKYASKNTGQRISLIVRESSSVLTGILDEAHFYRYDIVIVSASSNSPGGAGHIDMYTAIGVATEHDGTVILVRELEEEHGHLICVTDTEMSMEMVRKDTIMAARCGCPIYLYAVAADEEDLSSAQNALERAQSVVEKAGGKVSGKKAEIGDPVRRITDRGKDYSLIVISATEKSKLKQMFLGSVSHSILKKAKNSVMIVR